jgi:hypothetical protein
LYEGKNLQGQIEAGVVGGKRNDLLSIEENSAVGINSSYFVNISQYLA